MIELLYSRAFDWCPYFCRMTYIKEVCPTGYPAEYPVKLTP